jgi:hypothetical protein
LNPSFSGGSLELNNELSEQLWQQFSAQIESGEIEMNPDGTLKSALQIAKPWTQQNYFILVVYAVAIMLLILRVSATNLASRCYNVLALLVASIIK